MSADNYYLVCRHPKGGYAAVMGSASCDEEPKGRPGDEQFWVLEDAFRYAAAQYAEYGVVLDDALQSPLGTFHECPQCGGELRPEHAHYRCSKCGWRDSCCD